MLKKEKHKREYLCRNCKSKNKPKFNSEVRGIVNTITIFECVGCGFLTTD